MIKVLGRKCAVSYHTYGTTNRTCIRLVAPEDGPNGPDSELCVEGEPLFTATVNVAHEPLEPGQVLIKNCSENAGVYDALYAAGVVGPVIRFIDVGHAVNGGVVCELLKTPKKELVCN